MSGEEFVVAIVALVMGSLVVIVGISKLAGLIKAWINRNQHTYDEETFNRLARAFTQFKKDTERRLQNLEAGLGEDEQPSPGRKLEQPHNKIEIEDSKQEESETKSGNNNLRNMLRE